MGDPIVAARAEVLWSTNSPFGLHRHSDFAHRDSGTTTVLTRAPDSLHLFFSASGVAFFAVGFLELLIKGDGRFWTAFCHAWTSSVGSVNGQFCNLAFFLAASVVARLVKP